MKSILNCLKIYKKVQLNGSLTIIKGPRQKSISKICGQITFSKIVIQTVIHMNHLVRKCSIHAGYRGFYQRSPKPRAQGSSPCTPAK